MSIGPIDLQAVIASAKEAERVQSANQAREQSLAQGFNKALEARLDQEATSVRKVEQHETRGVDRDAKRGGKGAAGRQQREDRGKEEEQEEQPHGEIYGPNAGIQDLSSGDDHDREVTI